MRSDLRLGRLLAVWAPLAATFMLVTGSTPVVNACINRLPGRIHEADLAAFALFLSTIVVLHSPLFVAREIAIKLSVDRTGARRALRFCLGAALLIAVVEALLGATPLGAHLLGLFTKRSDVVEPAHRAFLYIWPCPLVIAARGVYQAHQIRADDTLYVGLGTLARLILTAFFGLLAAPHLGMTGAVLGAICLVLGITVETVFAYFRARSVARLPETSTRETPDMMRFALPLMFANMLGVLTSLFYLKVAARVPERLLESSLAAFQEVRPLAWLFMAGGWAMQSLTTAKVRSRQDEIPMVRFSLVVGFGLSSLLAVIAFVPPLRTWILVDLLGEKRGGTVVAFAGPALMWGSLLPLLQALRFALRGVLISRGRTRTITLTNILALTLIATAMAFDLTLQSENGALNAYLLWIGIVVIELAILARVVFRPSKEGHDLPPPARVPGETTGG